MKAERFLSLTLALILGASLQADESSKLEKVLIEQLPTNYASQDKSRIMRHNIKPDESAKSVQIFNETLLQDTHVQNISDAIKFSSNVSYLGDNNKMGEKIAIRGFSGVPILRDGFGFARANSFPEIFNLESLEVLKGPDSLQYGQTSPGGIVNLVVKKPLHESYKQLELEATSRHAYAPKIDLGGSLNEAQSIRYRLVGIARYEKDYRDVNTDTKRFFLAPSLAFDLGRNHQLTFIGEYLKEHTPTDFGTFINPDGSIGTPRKMTLSHPDERFDKEQKIVGFDLDSPFSSWNSNFKYRFIDYLMDFNQVYLPLIYAKDATGKVDKVTRFFSTQKFKTKEHALQYTLNKELQLAGKKHLLSLGIDYSHADDTRTSYVDRRFGAYTLDLKNPLYGRLTTLKEHPNAIPFGNSGVTITTQKSGIFLQDHFYWSDNLILNAGMRYSKVSPDFSQSSHAWTPQAGIVYKATPQTSLYASYSESFTPQSARQSDGTILKPEEGKGMELGIKQKLFQNRLALNASLFKIVKLNVAMTDPQNRLFSIPSGKQESRGFELDLSGDITSDTSIIASYGYTKSTDKAKHHGKELTHIPRHTAHLFATHYLSALDLPHLYIGAGVRYLGKRYVDAANTLKLDSALIYSASLGYKKGNWRGLVSLQNLTDEIYVEGSRSGTSEEARVGKPRTLHATFSYLF